MNLKNMKYTEQNLISDTSILLLLNLFASGLNYVYQILIANVLTVESFGTVNTIFSVMLVAAVPGTTITMLAARHLAIFKEKGAYQMSRVFVRNLTMGVSILGVCVFVMGFLFREILGSFLKINDTIILLITAVICALGYYHPLYSGCMSGLKKFIPLGIYALLIPMYKFIGLIGATRLQDEHYRLILCLAVIVPGSIITAVLGFIYIKKSLVGKDSCDELAVEMPQKEQWINSFVINICLTLYMNIDILAVRHIGGTEMSGLYSAVTLFGRIIYYGATSIGTVLLPMVATKDSKESFDLLKKVLFVVSGISIAGLLVLNLAKNLLINLIYGSNYIGAAEYVIYVSVIAFAIGILTIMVNFFVGIDYVKFPTKLMVVLTVIIIVAVLFIKNVSVTLLTIGVSGVVSIMILILQYRKEKNI